ncbi:TonB-dependent receptor plug domain-containing protein [Bacteroides thetaiotaomicron]|nr:TonB-dependent receptor plug domain-containing protein [Bacteroides thetaiotaomicron]
MLKTTASNMSQTLVGKLPGLITQQSLGQPGSDDVSILIRGYSSFSGSGTVLVLVDGVERAMGQVDPNDVESVTILKDAASCAVYGMKAANGVVLVTTKHGQEGKTDITYRGSMTLSHATTLPKMMNNPIYAMV